ncbi:MAG: hypothetical protein Q9218_000171 [Villophora microphyllina]
MPTARRSAAFDPISPDLDLDALVQQTPNFEYVTRISCDMIETQAYEQFEKLLLLHVIVGGKPLVIEGFHKRLDEWTFTSGWLQDNHGKKYEQARNLSKQTNMTVSIGHYLSNMAKLANQWNCHNYRDRDRQRLYLKDIDCPQVWHDKLREVIPPTLFYLNDSVGNVDGPGSVDEPNPYAPGLRKGRGVARAGDLMSCLPPGMRADNLMCYIGHEGTYTPAHREMCASLGQNLMVETSGSVDLDSKPTKPGSSIWFMTESKDRHIVSEYWLSTLGHDIEIESHFAQINAWKSAPFTTYIVEQKVGDFILIPPLAPHQVWNRGTRTMKVAWNRTTVETLELAVNEALPRARMVGRDEQYKNKAMVYFALERYSHLLQHVEHQRATGSDPYFNVDVKYGGKIKQLQKDFRRLFSLFTRILLSETLPNNPKEDKKTQYLPFDKCYAMGRSCRCISGYKWVEQFNWKTLVEKHENWRRQINEFKADRSEKMVEPFHIERESMRKKPLAQVCQEQLKLRPWNDPGKPAPEPKLTKDADESQANADGTVTVKKKKSQVIEKGHMKNHITNYPEPIWKLGVCNCGRAYSYGSLFRAFDTMPLTVMEDPDWQCPHCRSVCSCGKCRKVAGMQPYEPTGTVLGYDTRRVADPRSTESLVDFRQSNFDWVKKAGDDLPAGEETRRLSRRFDQAEAAKSQGDTLDEAHYVDEGEDAPMTNGHMNDGSPTLQAADGEIPIDPLLGGTPSKGLPSRQSVSHGHAADEDDVLEDGTNREPPHRFVAPAAVMLDQRHLGGGFTTDANGIVFQYPDPTDPDPTVPQFAPPQVEQRPQPLNGADQGKKTKRSDPLESGLLDPNEANKQYHKEQVKRTLAEARRNNRYIIAEAAMSGKSLLVTLRVDRSQVAHITSQAPNQAMPPPMRKPNHIIVQSDYPPPGGKNQATRNPLKRVRVEHDDEFSTKKDKRRKSGQRLSLPEGVGKPTTKPSKFMEISSASEDEDRIDIDRSAESRLPKPRQLPAYLAKKSDIGDSEIPKELSSEPKIRSSRGKSAITHLAANNRPGLNNGRPHDGNKPSRKPIDDPAEANRRAKLRAMQWDHDDSSEESEPESPREKRYDGAPRPANASRFQNTSPNLSSKGKALHTPSSVPNSIFSKGKKIRIMSAKGAPKPNGQSSRHSLT